MTTSGSLEDEPLFRLGLWVTGVVDTLVGRVMALVAAAGADPGRLLIFVATVGLACAFLAWGLGSAFARLNQPARRAPTPAPPAQVVVQAVGVTRAGGARRRLTRPRRRDRRKGSSLLRWLGRG